MVLLHACMGSHEWDETLCIYLVVGSMQIPHVILTCEDGEDDYCPPVCLLVVGIQVLFGIVLLGWGHGPSRR